MNGCPTEEALTLLLRDRLLPEQLAPVEDHVDRCAGCQAVLDRLTRGEAGDTVALLRRARRGAPNGSEAGAWHRALTERVAGARPRPSLGGLPQVDGYDVFAELGRGGMAVVYRARHAALGREVALKMLPAGAALAPVLRERLRREALALARLSHPNIVQIYDTGEQDGQPFFSLELVEGSTLARWTAGIPRPPRVAAEVVLTVAGAIEYAHQNGILHRDLKPSNILLGVAAPCGDRFVSPDTPLTALQIKVTDFGLAAGAPRGAGADPLTLSGAIVGTPSYMAPEQARGADVGPAADVYALGAVLYELLTGRPPFRAAAPFQTLLQVVHDDPVPVSRLQPRLPRDLATICAKCLEKDPGRRYARALDLADDLRRFLAHEPIRARPVGPVGRFVRWGRRRPALAGPVLAAAAVAVAGAGLVFWQWREAVGARTRAEALALSEAAAGAAAHEQRAAADGARRAAERATAELVLDRGLERCDRGDVAGGLAEFARGLDRAAAAGLDDLQPVFRTNIAAWGAQLLRPNESPPLGSSITAVAFSPDGKRLAVGQWANKLNVPGPGEVRVWDPVGWKPLGPAFQHAGPVTAVAYSPDGAQLLTAGMNGTVQVWDAATGRAIGTPLSELGTACAVAYRADGRAFAAAGTVRGSAEGVVRVWDAATRQPLLPPLTCPGPALSVAFSPDGRVIAAGHGTAPGQNQTGGGARLWDVATGRPVGTVLLHSSPVRAVAFSPNGKALLTGGEEKATQLWNWAAGRRFRAAHAHPFAVHCAAFTPDGRGVLVGGGDHRRVGGGSDGAGLWDVLTGKPLLAPLPHPDVVHALAVSPDGRRTATGCRDGHVRVWEVGNLRPAVERIHNFRLAAVSFGPDSRLVVCGGEPEAGGGEVRVWRAGADAPVGPPVRQAARIEAVVVAPDGRTYATGDADGGVQVWGVATGRPVGGRLAHNGPIETLIFTADGSRLLVVSPARGANLWDLPSARLLWASAPGEPPRSAVPSSDGSAVLVGGTDGTVRLWDVATGRVRTEFSAGRRDVQVVLSPDGSAVLTGGVDGAARLWDAATGRPLSPPLEHAGDAIWGIGFTSVPGRVYTVAGTPYRDRGAVRLWDTATGRAIVRLPQQVAVRAVCTSPDRSLIATAGWGGDVRLWDVNTGRPVGPSRSTGGLAHALAFAPDGRTVAAAGEDGVLRAWNVPAPVGGTTGEVTGWVQTLTGDSQPFNR